MNNKNFYISVLSLKYPMLDVAFGLKNMLQIDTTVLYIPKVINVKKNKATVLDFQPSGFKLV